MSGTTASAAVTAVGSAGGKASASVTLAQIKDAMEKAENAAGNTGKIPAVEIKVSVPDGTSIVEIRIPHAAIREIASEGKSNLKLSSPVATITFDAGSLGTISGKVSEDVIFTLAKTLMLLL
ncbi:hypothetical protein LY28_00325 [Ruminiclostridium sufflavum DSM 19573]|uniref:Uncharacterized protein n=1 Tax=Ruminiclostridium sufflavum DSM 19573 TaxID=1121337 RepID=A0A318XSQ6_9FIRM|nr:hypothetical protein [Ruminiclostridium sufflavum]PYG89732.1 hypothetical protein LY28_00325 [Ruminiclostridium sufflavum DSM 19573]